MSEHAEDRVLEGARPSPDDGGSTWELGAQPATISQAAPSPPPAGRRSWAARSAGSGGQWIRYGKAISATVLVMFIAADVGVNLAHNTAAVVSRVVPFMDDRSFYFDPLAVIHDLETVAR